MKTIEEAIEDIKKHLIGLCEVPNYEEDNYAAGYITAIDEKTSEIFKAGVEFAQRWISIEDELPTGEDEVLLFNKKWINKDYNPKGIRIGFLGGDGFISAHWWNYQDCYMTISKNECENNSKFSDDIKNNTEPTHWRYLELK